MRYPDVRIESADKKFFGTHFPAFAGTAGVERVATGFRWAEGPAFSREGNYLIFSDIPNNRMMRLYGTTITSASSASRRTIPTAIRSIRKGAS
jgi:sugar lactone lactonase YvrE